MLVKKYQKIYLLLCLVLVMALTGCEKKKADVFHISGTDLSYEETLAFGFIYTRDANVNDREVLEEPYDATMSYGEYHKKQIKDDIVNTLLLYKEGKENKISLSSEDKDEIDIDSEELISYYGEGFLKSFNIEKNDIKHVFEMKAYANKYLERLANIDEEENVDRYVKVYQVTFLTAKLDENGGYALDENGDVVMMDDSKVKEQKEKAQEFANQLKDGEEIEDLLKTAGKNVIGAEKYLKYDDLSEAYKKAVDGLSVGKTSEPFTFNYGYYVIKMLSQDGEDYAKAISAHDLATLKNDVQIQEVKRLQDKEIGNSKEYIEEDVWNTIGVDMLMK